MTDHPIQLVNTDDLRRGRLGVFFRLILVIPHLVWVTVWGIAVFFAVIASWFATLVRGQTPGGLHDFIARYMRYATHVQAYLTVMADRYPAFTGRDPYPIDAVIAPPAPQNRWKTGFRIILAIPMLVVGYVLGMLLELLAVGAWFLGVILGREPEGLQALGAWCIGVQLRTNAYVALLTDRYPSFEFGGDGAILPRPRRPIAGLEGSDVA
jgi:uncharacterized protein DUF4389